VGGVGVFVLVKDESDVSLLMILIGIALLAMTLLTPDHALERFGERLPRAIETLLGLSQAGKTGESSSPSTPKTGDSSDAGPPLPRESPLLAIEDIEGLVLGLRSKDASTQLSAIEKAERLRGFLGEAQLEELWKAAHAANPRGLTRHDRRVRKQKIDSLVALLADGGPHT
jgi:hypothetical protein